MESTPLPTLCGQLLIIGFPGDSPTATLRTSLARGERGGVVLFKRNLRGEGEELATHVAAMNRSLAGSAPSHLPLLLAIDQEGGRVARLGPPVLGLPSMRALAAAQDADLVEQAACALGRELRALGFTMNFAPVLDVDSNPDNPIIGDRSFGRSPGEVIRHGLAFARGLRSGGLLSCGKHFPGHGDTTKDSHVELPEVKKSREELLAVELEPFRAAAASGIDALMSAHVLYPALDAERPATLSRSICTQLLRVDLGFRGLLLSDDLEMKALSSDVGATSVQAVRAGCDALLVCSDEGLADVAHEALVREAERDPAFRARCQEAASRGLELRRKHPPGPAEALARRELFAAHARLGEALRERLREAEARRAAEVKP